MLSSALVPTFSALSKDEADREAVRRYGELLGALIGLATLVLAVLVGALWLAALPIAQFISGGPNQDPVVVATLLRLTIPAILFLNISGILTAALQARRRFGYTAFTAAMFNVVMIAVVVVFQKSLGVAALALGLLMGSLTQVLMQAPGLRDVPVKLSLNWRLPGVAQVIKLFLPVAGGLVLAQIAVQVSFIFASHISEQGPATMRYAAQVIQFPLGMVVSAVAAAILPPLSSAVGHDFKATLAQGLRLVWTLIVPASVGLFVLAAPVIALLFEHGAFGSQATAYTASALRAAVPGCCLPRWTHCSSSRSTPNAIRARLRWLVWHPRCFIWCMCLACRRCRKRGARAFTLDDLIFANSLRLVWTLH